uniref:Uncharacterized protein n=1 Tax=Haptolina ericina TaxID=156174 RepID=A0A7S3FGQ3_9EUKA|mmetsp:Transcript_66309/g.148020  ORF Transcript_66309/g.148020 Transcript_66309/m.148020 type:complete len:210 (+) Transcript_66309:739-1368(+)
MGWAGLPVPRIQSRRQLLAGPQVVDAYLQGALQIVVRPGLRLLQAGLDFLEKIAEGFVIEAYNSTKEKGYDSKLKEKQMKLDAYDLPMLERALEEMRGKKPPACPLMRTAARAADGLTVHLAAGGSRRRWSHPSRPTRSAGTHTQHVLRVQVLSDRRAEQGEEVRRGQQEGAGGAGHRFRLLHPPALPARLPPMVLVRGAPPDQAVSER